MLLVSSNPFIPHGNPGKFSTLFVVVSCPPGCNPLITSGDKFARAAYVAAVSPAQPLPTMTILLASSTPLRILRQKFFFKRKIKMATDKMFQKNLDFPVAVCLLPIIT
jgi:hypothetical protein